MPAGMSLAEHTLLVLQEIRYELARLNDVLDQAAPLLDNPALKFAAGMSHRFGRRRPGGPDGT